MGKKRAVKRSGKRAKVASGGNIASSLEVWIRAWGALELVERRQVDAIVTAKKVLRGFPYVAPERKPQWQEKPSGKDCYWWVEGKEGVFVVYKDANGSWSKRRLDDPHWSDLWERVAPVTGRPD